MLADTVVLTTGERLHGTVAGRSDAFVIFEHPVLGRLKLASDVIEQVILDEDSQPAEEAAPDEPVEETPTPEIVEESQWKSRVEIGFGISDGNTENSNLNINFVTKRENEKEATTFDAAYFYAEDNSETSTNKATIGVNQDWKLTDSAWIIFARARYDYDEFNSWRGRVTGGGGVGYRFYDTDDFKLTGRVGLGAAKEFDSTRDDVRLEGLLGLDLAWKLDEHQEFVLGSTYFPDFDESGEFRILTTAMWKLNLPQYDGASVFIGLRHEYQSLVDAGQDETDIFVYGGVGIDF